MSLLLGVWGNPKLRMNIFERPVHGSRFINCVKSKLFGCWMDIPWINPIVLSQPGFLGWAWHSRQMSVMLATWSLETFLLSYTSSAGQSLWLDTFDNLNVQCQHDKHFSWRLHKTLDSCVAHHYEIWIKINPTFSKGNVAFEPGWCYQANCRVSWNLIPSQYFHNKIIEKRLIKKMQIKIK